MKVLFVTRKWPPAVGGMETYSRDLTRELAKQVNLEIWALPGTSQGDPPGTARVALFFLRTAVLLIGRRGSGFDIIHFGDFVLFPLAWLHSKRYPKTPRVITVHGLDVIYGNRAGWKPRLYRAFMRWARKCRDAVDAIITNSRNTSRLVEQAGLGQSLPIPLGVDCTTAESVAVGASDTEEPYVLFVGRLVRRKGAAWFASEVMPLLPASVHFRVVGKPWDIEEVTLLDDNKRVDRLGYVSDRELAVLRARAVAVVMPNIPSEDERDVEGFGIAALEAAISGTPLLAADTDGITDAVVDGTTGFLLPPLAPDAWAEAVTRLMKWSSEDRRRHAVSARDKVAADFSWERVARDTVVVYKRIIAG